MSSSEWAEVVGNGSNYEEEGDNYFLGAFGLLGLEIGSRWCMARIGKGDHGRGHRPWAKEDEGQVQ